MENGPCCADKPTTHTHVHVPGVLAALGGQQNTEQQVKSSITQGEGNMHQ